MIMVVSLNTMLICNYFQFNPNVNVNVQLGNANHEHYGAVLVECFNDNCE